MRSKIEPIISVSGIRGIVNQSLDGSFAASIGRKFGLYVNGGAVAVANDTRTTCGIIKEPLVAGLLESGCLVYDLGYSSTPSTFKEVIVRNLEGALIVTASHNPPEWNGIKFIVKGGRSVFEQELQKILGMQISDAPEKHGRVFNRRAAYYEILAAKAGKGAARGIRVAIDLAGGVGCFFISRLLGYEGCEVESIHDSPGIFPRIIDPTNDPLRLLSNIVVEDNCEAGFAFDCDADRLVIVDEKGKKLSGDATLLICLKHFLENTRNRTVAISVDTSLAAEDLIREYNGSIVYSKVGEANVLRKIIEHNCGAGGEGSSGGYIEPNFVMCRDGVYASTIIVKMIKSEGQLSTLSPSSYFQARKKIETDPNIAKLVLAKIAETQREVDLTDGVKIKLRDRSWVLIRGSNTENVMRVSAEARSQAKADALVEQYSNVILELLPKENRNSQ